MEILRQSKPKSKKEHTCDFCIEKIEKGKVYNSDTISHGDEFYTWKTHLKCAIIANKLTMYEDSQDGVTSDEFQDYITEEFKRMHEEGFKLPSFQERLNYVCTKYGITIL